MLIIPASDTIAGAAPSGATEVTCTLELLELNASTGAQTYTRDQQQLAASAATIYTATADGPTLVRSISVVNTDTVNASTFQLFAGGTAAGNAITPVWTIPAGGIATYEDHAGWTFMGPDGQPERVNGFRSIGVQRFLNTGAGTYRPPVGLRAAVVIATGGGGGGGGVDTSGGSGDVGIGGGGGAGGTAIGFFTAAQVGASKAFSVGTAGNGGNTNGSNGGAGGNTTWDTTTLVGTGGALGTGSGLSGADSQASAGGLGGVPTGGTINVTGGDGLPGVAGSADMATVDLVFGLSGKGGASFWGDGGLNVARAQNNLTTDGPGGGSSGVCYGAGGSGSVDLTATTGGAGGAGMSGIIAVIEFIG